MYKELAQVTESLWLILFRWCAVNLLIMVLNHLPEASMAAFLIRDYDLELSVSRISPACMCWVFATEYVYFPSTSPLLSSEKTLLRNSSTLHPCCKPLAVLLAFTHQETTSAAVWKLPPTFHQLGVSSWFYFLHLIKCNGHFKFLTPD